MGRAARDRFAAESHHRALRATEEGRFAGEIVPIPVRDADGAERVMDRDVGLYEVNEAFASVPLAWLADLGADPERLNVNGGAIALGHPLGATGARLMTSLVAEMERSGTRFGLQAMCEGGGMANATMLELCP